MNAVWKRRVVKTACFAGCLYLLVVLMFALIQSFLVFPGKLSQGRTKAPVIDDAHGEELLTLTTATGEKVQALFGAALTMNGQLLPDAAQSPTIVYFYGNGMSLTNCENEFHLLRHLGANVLIPDYLGYGLSGGKASEAGCYETADACYAWLVHDPRVDPKKIIVGGWSLGAAVAIDLAARQPVAGLFTASAFTSMVETAKRLYAWLPVHTLLRHRFMSIDKIGKVHCPTIIGHGRLDDLVPAWMADKLAEAAGGPVTRVEVARAGHNDFWVVGTGPMAEAISRLLEQVRQ